MSGLSLTQLVIELVRRLKGVEPNASVKASIYEVVESNGLEKYDDVPSWLIKFFRSIIDGQSTEKVYIYEEESQKSEADVWNFLAELENILGIESDDYGEGIEMVFKPLGIYAFISLESGFYRIQSAKDTQCTSYAAKKLSDSSSS
ncbi:hypothetical protein [Nostoc sp. UHCC 0252]|uniref:hypothetical protein n=1 Tax=Nostoc sp. UHCC 0252 TaxID=3110241 RepID=UPI002B1EEB69|nr:hypothetical protein [Nostoc sp. UHCC 0252]MEA5601284.1 hypothetical protein [Nostoc sp. UHCC 0252]